MGKGEFICDIVTCVCLIVLTLVELSVRNYLYAGVFFVCSINIFFMSKKIYNSEKRGEKKELNTNPWADEEIRAIDDFPN